MSATDYLIVGATTTAGRVLASRLKEYEPSVSITLIDLNIDESRAQDSPSERERQAGRSIGEGSTNQPGLRQERELLPTAGSITSPNWSRSGARDFDRWAGMVHDDTWSYDNLQPWFQRVEATLTRGIVTPVQSPKTSTHRHASESIRRILLDASENSRPSASRGNDKAVALYTEEYGDQNISVAQSYPLEGIETIVRPVECILFKGSVARGVKFVDGETIIAQREVIITAGAVFTPQLLLRSGIGPARDLAEHAIEVVADSPHVGHNLHAQSAFVQHLRVSQRAAGNGDDDVLAYKLGMPLGLMLTASIPQAALKPALIADGEIDVDESHPFLNRTRGHLRLCTLYVPRADFDSKEKSAPGINLVTINSTPTSRGSIKLSTMDPESLPVVNLNHNATEADRTVMRSGIRLAARAFESQFASSAFCHQAAPPGLSPLRSTSSDAVLDNWINRVGLRTVSVAGTAAMGKVVDTNLRVLGVQRLRVVDESVVPCPIGADPRAVSCILAEQAASFIAMAWNPGDECSPF